MDPPQKTANETISSNFRKLIFAQKMAKRSLGAGGSKWTKIDPQNAPSATRGSKTAFFHMLKSKNRSKRARIAFTMPQKRVSYGNYPRRGFSVDCGSDFPRGWLGLDFCPPGRLVTGVGAARRPRPTAATRAANYRTTPTICRQKLALGTATPSRRVGDDPVAPDQF